MDKEVGEAWKEYTLEDLLDTVRGVSNLGDTEQPYMTVTTVQLLQAYWLEEGIKKRIETFNKQQATES